MPFQCVSSARFPTQWAEFTVHAFSDGRNDGREHLALSLGELRDRKSGILTRVHSSCLTGDALFSLRCDCGAQLQSALQRIAGEETGILLYLQQEGRGIGLTNKIRAYHLQDEGADTVDANLQLGFAPDRRKYSACRDIFSYFGIRHLRLMTNNPAKVKALSALGLEITEQLPHRTGRNPHNEKYLQTKIDKLGHLP